MRMNWVLGVVVADVQFCCASIVSCQSCRHGLLLFPQDIAKRYPDGFPQLDPAEDMGISDPATISAVQEVNKLELQLVANPGRWGA